MKPGRRPTSGLARGTDPYRQGDLDGLCGVYAVINVVSALCPELDEANARSLFRKLVRALASNVDKPLGTVCFGMDTDCVKFLLAVAKHDVEKRFKVHLKIRPYRRETGPLSLPAFWRTLSERLRPDQVAVVGLGGAFDHWTVARRISGRTMVLLDSAHLRSLPRSKVTLHKTRSRYRFDPQEIIFVKRPA